MAAAGQDGVRAIFRRRGHDDDAEMDITPMIDITFLLLIFFLVAAKIDSDGGVPLPPAEYGVPVAATNSVIVTIASGGEGEGVVYLGDGIDEATLASGDVEDQATAITEYIEQNMGPGGGKEHVLVKAEGGVKHGEVARVLSAIGPGTDVEVLNVAVLETQ